MKISTVELQHKIEFLNVIISSGMTTWMARIFELKIGSMLPNFN
jgi:hypothetical protein